MAFWNRRSKQPAEARSSIENPNVPISNERIIEYLGFGGLSESGVNVTVESALGVPAVWSAVNFIASTIASLPIKGYIKTDEGRFEFGADSSVRRPPGTPTGRNHAEYERQLISMLNHAPNEYTTAFQWRKQSMQHVLTHGRSYTEILRSASGNWRLRLLDPRNVTPPGIEGGAYVYESGDKKREIKAGDVLDLSFSMSLDSAKHLSPINLHRDTIGLAISATRYGSRFFQNGGVPPFVLTGAFQSGGALDRASEDLQRAVKQAASKDRLALTLPAGHEIKTLGDGPEKAQLVELKRFLIEEIARIYSLPPVFLQDLTHGTFSNTEQQDLHFVKHTVSRWVRQFEQQLNLKLFGWGVDGRYVEFNMDGLLRGDFKTRMDGYAQGIQNALITPNEARAKENWAPKDGGDLLHIQGATVPLGSQPMQTETDDAEGN